MSNRIYDNFDDANKAEGLFTLPCVDKYGTAENCSHNALSINAYIRKGHPVAIPLNVDNITMYHISFIPLLMAIPSNCAYGDGSNRGIQINIDRKSSYSLSWGMTIKEELYIYEKWVIDMQSSKLLLHFFNTVLTGKDHFKEYGKEVMHKLTKVGSSKAEFEKELNEI